MKTQNPKIENSKIAENFIRYKGKGEHSVNELEKIIEQREEELHHRNSKPLDLFESPDVDKHTRGEARISQRDDILFPYVRVIRVGGICIAQAEGETIQIAEANAQRIVKAVNMHDELLRGIKNALNLYGRGYEPKEGAEPTIGSELYLELSDLLKQAEQK